jgi:hypothetical protein
VPAYTECTDDLTNWEHVHGPPLQHVSCNPPQQTSSFLTVGTPDAGPGNGPAANSIGSARFAVLPGDPATTADEADVSLNVSITDVRCLQASGGCPSGYLADYTGQLQVRSTVRITDKLNGPTQTVAGTGEVTYNFALSCTATASTSVGSTCSTTTSADAVQGGTIRELKRTIWQLGQIEVYDGGSDGVASTSPNTVFAKQGVFVP